MPLVDLAGVPLPSDPALCELRLLQYAAGSMLVCQASSPSPSTASTGAAAAPTKQSEETVAPAAPPSLGHERRQRLQWPLEVPPASSIPATISRGRGAGRPPLSKRHAPTSSSPSSSPLGFPMDDMMEPKIGSMIPEIVQEALITHQMAEYATGWHLKLLSDLTSFSSAGGPPSAFSAAAAHHHPHSQYPLPPPPKATSTAMPPVPFLPKYDAANEPQERPSSRPPFATAAPAEPPMKMSADTKSATREQPYSLPSYRSLTSQLHYLPPVTKHNQHQQHHHHAVEATAEPRYPSN